MRLTATLSAFAALVGAAVGGPTAANAGGYHTEYVFKGGSDAAYPHAALMSLGSKLYGTSPGDGANGLGTVYSLDPKTGAEAVIHAFTGGSDGAYAYGRLINVNGTLYGTTAGGGGSSDCGGGCGTVFSLDPATGAETVVYAFNGGSDGDIPSAGLIKVGGLLYGTTLAGGSSNCAGGCGTVFSVNPRTGVEAVAYVFKGGGDGSDPHSGLIDVAGTLYGTTENGGFSNCFQGCGTVFSFNPTTGAEAVVYAFKGGNDGAGLVAGLIEVGGVLYGTTVAGGGSSNCGSGGCGTVFSLDPTTGAETVVYAFKGGSDGFLPLGDLITADGFLYGATEAGGYKHGTVFSLNLTTDAKTVLHAFKGRDDGAYPDAGLVYADHRLYGTTDEGGGYPDCGKFGCGTVFTIRP